MSSGCAPVRRISTPGRVAQASLPPRSCLRSPPTFDAQPVNHEAQARLTAIGTPAQGTKDWVTVLADVGHFQTAAAQALAAARTADVSAWQTAFSRFESAKDAVRSDLAQSGFKASGSCQLVFWRTTEH